MNKPPATRRGDTPVNALTAFVRDTSEGRYKGPVALGKAAGFTRQTAANLLNDERPVLPKLPPRETLEALARAFPEVGLARIEEIANKAVSPHDPDLPLTRGDLKRAHTDDLEYEMARRRRILSEGNERREERRLELVEVWSAAQARAVGLMDAMSTFADGQIRRVMEETGQFRHRMLELLRDIGAMAVDPSEKWREEADRIEEGVVQRLGNNEAWAMHTVLMHEADVNWARTIYIRIGARADYWKAMRPEAAKIEEDPLPEDDAGTELSLAKSMNRSLGKLTEAVRLDRRSEGGREIWEQHQEVVDQGLRWVGVGADKDELQLRLVSELAASHPVRRLSILPPSSGGEELGWAARDYPDWAKKPDPQDGSDEGV